MIWVFLFAFVNIFSFYIYIYIYIYFCSPKRELGIPLYLIQQLYLFASYCVLQELPKANELVSNWTPDK